MNELKEKHLRPGRKITDQFIIAPILTFLIMSMGVLIPIGFVLFPVFEKLLGDHDAAVFLKDYFDFIGIWVSTFLAVIVIKSNWPMLNAVKYHGFRSRDDAGEVPGIKRNRPGNNIVGLLIGLALGFGVNAFCVLMSVLTGDIHLKFSGFKLVPFVLFFVCVFIQSAAEELTDRWFLYQKLRRRYKAPWIAIFVNSFAFMAMHLPNPGVTFLGLLQVFVVGLLFSLFVYYYNGLWMAMAFHAAWNFTQSIFFGLPNSGIVSAYSVFRLDAASARSGLFYNVNFGVEGSIAANVILITLCIIVFMKNKDKGEQTDIWAQTDKTAAGLRLQTEE